MGDGAVITIERIKEMIEEEKKANPMLLDSFTDTNEFEIGIKIGMEAMHEYLSTRYDFVEKKADGDK